MSALAQSSRSFRFQVTGWSRPILLKNSVFKIIRFAFAICRRFRIVDARRKCKHYENASWCSSRRLVSAIDCAQDQSKIATVFSCFLEQSFSTE
jgi:hypothetical protein